MPTKKISVQELTDEEVLKEFVKRFQCDGAVLIYLDSQTEFGFGRWRNASGRKWVNNTFKKVKEDLFWNLNCDQLSKGAVVPIRNQ